MKKEKMSSIGSDKNKAARYIVIGIVIAVIFGTVVGISKSLAIYATQWAEYEDQLNTENYWTGAYGDTEFDRRAREIDLWTEWMQQQPIYFANIATFGVNIGLVLLTIGFVGFAINDSLDERTRRASLILAAIVMFVLMFTSFFSVINFDIY